MLALPLLCNNSSLFYLHVHQKHFLHSRSLWKFGNPVVYKIIWPKWAVMPRMVQITSFKTNWISFPYQKLLCWGFASWLNFYFYFHYIPKKVRINFGQKFVYIAECAWLLYTYEWLLVHSCGSCENSTVLGVLGPYSSGFNLSIGYLFLSPFY